MANESDLSSDIEELYRTSAIQNNRQVKRTLLPKGVCYNCDEPFENEEQLYCDSDCRLDHEKRVRNSIKVK